MCQKFIVDNLIYMTNTYHFSGYRFDLMGLLDIPTMELIDKNLRKIEPKIMLYGEGWNMPNTLPENMRPCSQNARLLPSYAFFNDTFRDIIKGSQWGDSLGFITGKKVNEYDLLHILTGSVLANNSMLRGLVEDEVKSKYPDVIFSISNGENARAVLFDKSKDYRYFTNHEDR